MRLVGDVWLLDLGLTSKQAHLAAGILLRTQVRTANQTGHVLDFSFEGVRKHINRFARLGRTPVLPVRCIRCGCQQLLPRWITACDMTAEGRAHLAKHFPSMHKMDADYLRPCPGDQHLQDAIDILGVPDTLEEPPT